MSRARTRSATDGFFEQPAGPARGQYPFTLPVVRHRARAGGLELDRR